MKRSLAYTKDLRVDAGDPHFPAEDPHFPTDRPHDFDQGVGTERSATLVTRMRAANIAPALIVDMCR
jgi:hypothetical protein